jgi:hypothetical protein
MMSTSIVIWVEVLLNLNWMFWVWLLKVLIDIMIPFPHKKYHEHKSYWWLITLIMRYILQVYNTKWANTDCVVSLFIILLCTYFYVLWILKIVLITSPWNILNGMIVFLAFGYCISYVVFVCVCIHHMYVLSKWKMERI